MKQTVLLKHIAVPIVLLASLSATAPVYAGGAPTSGSSWPVGTTFYNEIGPTTFLLNGSTFTISYDGMADSWTVGQPHSPSSLPTIGYALSAPATGYGGGTVSEIGGNQSTFSTASASNGQSPSGNLTVAQSDSFVNSSAPLARGLGVNLNFTVGGGQSSGSAPFNVFIVWKITGPNGKYNIRLAEGVLAKATTEAFVWGSGSQQFSSSIQTAVNALGFGGGSTATVQANTSPGYAQGNTISVSNNGGPIYEVDETESVTITNGVGYFAINLPPQISATNTGAGDVNSTSFGGYQPIQVSAAP